VRETNNHNNNNNNENEKNEQNWTVRIDFYTWKNKNRYVGIDRRRDDGAHTTSLIIIPYDVFQGHNFGLPRTSYPSHHIHTHTHTHIYIYTFIYSYCMLTD